MREYGQIQCSFWTDPDMQGLSDAAARLACYLLTGPHSNGLGCYRLPDGYIQADFGWTSQTVSKAFQELFETGFCKRCQSTQFVLIPKFLRWNPIANANVAKAREKEFEAVPRKASIYGRLAASMLDYAGHLSEPFRNRLETLSKQDPTRPDPEPDPDRTREKEPSGSSPDVEKTTSEAKYRIPMTGSKSHPVTQEDIDKYRGLFPAVDVEQSIRTMLAWLDSNPDRRSGSVKGAKSRMTSWLARDQDKAGRQSSASKTNESPSERAAREAVEWRERHQQSGGRA